MKRKKIKTILCHMAIITICAGVFCHGYINGFSISKYDRIYSYAEADNWSSCDTSDLVTAFRYYCKSRNLAIEGSVADALTSFTTTTFNNICSTLGIDPTQLQAELKKTTAGNLGLRFLFSQTGITAYNRIFSEFLQNNDLEVGEDVDNKTIYSGKSINGSLVYYVNRKAASDYTGNVLNLDFSPTDNSYITVYGTSINNIDFITMSPWNQIVQCSFVNYTANCSVYPYSTSKGGDWYYLSIYYPLNYSDNNGFNSSTGFPIRNSDNPAQPLLKSHACYVHFSDGNLMPCIITFTINNKFCIRQLGFNYKEDTENVKDVDITLTTNNNTINNNTYNSNYTIIYNDGDTYISDDDNEPGTDTPPSGGGGGGGGDPDNWNPSTPTIPEPTNPNFPTVNLPDIDIPDLPSLNFSLGDLRNKFPFSLPFDIIAVLNVLDGEPQAPHIEATVPIGRWYTWEMDFDFAEFDNYARIFRAFEFIGFCIGLAIFTVHFVKG